MTHDLRLLAYSAVLTWVMLMASSLLRTRAWTSIGLGLAFGNRSDVPEPFPAAARADRAARNMFENLVLFGVLLLGAHAGGVDPSRLDLGAELFFWARVAYFPTYIAGVSYLRTALWAIGVAGLASIFFASMF